MNMKMTMALEFFDDLFRRLTNAYMPISQPIYPIKASEAAAYSVLTRAR